MASTSQVDIVKIVAGVFPRPETPSSTQPRAWEHASGARCFISLASIVTA